MESGRPTGQIAANADEDVEIAFARVLAAEEDAERAVRDCQMRAEALHGQVEEALCRLAERSAARRARRTAADAAVEAAALGRFEQARAEAEQPVQLDADDRSRLMRAVAMLAGELCGDDG
ncbi:MAG: hypothetical protein KDH15_20380 [Rhodocyclaceae bacterium]|nr:hypothetical protein [Rhodocyclaceae bacterium]